MSAGWVAGSVRAKGLLSRRLGAGGTRAIAGLGSLAEAQHALADGPYGRGIVVGQSAADTEHLVTATPLWQLRVLAGWLPREGARAIRSLAAGFEAANIVSHARALAGAPPEPLFDLGALATAWLRLRETSSLSELRRALSQSLWGDPGGDAPSDIATGVQVAWAVRAATTVPEAGGWAAGGLALLVARQHLLHRRQLRDDVSAHAARVLGTAALGAGDLTSFAAALPSRARWSVAGIQDAGELWRGEARWWTRLERDGFQLVAGTGFGRARPVGTAAVLAADAWRCRAAVHLAARGGGPMEAYDALT
ncbi:hypothetical protein JDV09_03040 [Mycobacterium sp. Y57]|uniref:hypothetical protein n=1 Tax=Mycolicibacterium xanthum TaxID=2796469 RepID=UPI001C845E0A|nr:hypothetical protein [Mycolicibacterium xanthum]MBX7431089.1 hypothetical protein [Mycolicibacterium xanthum]